MPAAEIQSVIHKATAPSTPEEIGITRERLQYSYRLAQQLRYRYNVLDWTHDLGQWSAMVDALFLPGGFWAK